MTSPMAELSPTVPHLECPQAEQFVVQNLVRLSALSWQAAIDRAERAMAKAKADGEMDRYEQLSSIYDRLCAGRSEA